MPLPWVAVGFWSFIGSFVVSLILPVVKAVVVALGFGLVTYVGTGFVIDEGRDWVLAQFAGMPSDMVQILYLLKLDQGIRMVFAAISANITIRSILGATIKPVWKKPGGSPVLEA